jgi:hypothetical protein
VMRVVGLMRGPGRRAQRVPSVDTVSCMHDNNEMTQVGGLKLSNEVLRQICTTRTTHLHIYPEILFQYTCGLSPPLTDLDEQDVEFLEASGERLRQRAPQEKRIGGRPVKDVYAQHRQFSPLSVWTFVNNLRR